MPDEPASHPAPEHPEPDASRNYWPGGADDIVATLSDGTLVKRRMMRMRACTQKDAKGKMCRGHIKRWFAPTAEARQFAATLGGTPEIYRCERCKTIYVPNAAEPPRTQTMSW